jgi:predicted ABC-type exoprotein transport system permease subunit
MPAWLSYIVGAVVAVLIALLLAPIIPEPGGHIVAVIAWIVAAILAILALVALLRGSRV